MTIFGVIVAVIASGLYYSVHSQMELRGDYILSDVIERTKVTELFGVNKIQDTRLAFKVDANGELISSNYAIKRSELTELINLATKDRGYLAYHGYTFKYLVRNHEYAFVDMTYDVSRVDETLRTISLISTMALVFVFISSTILASWALKPVEASWKKQKTFISDASHELRTPIAVISANAQLLKDHPKNTVQEQMKSVHYIHEEAKRMTELVERLLFLAKNDQTKQHYAFEIVNLSDIVYETVLPLESIAFEQGKALRLEVADNVMIKGDKATLKQLVVILLDNAIKYSPSHEPITVSLQKKGILTVQNFGEIIPAEKLIHLFERFYRVDESRQRETQGYGLGLSIAQTIVMAHKAKIDVASTLTEGTVFTVTFTK